jgi:excisionase family DNA binding protein
MKRRNRGRKAEPIPGGIESEIMTLYGVADYLNCHYSTVHRLIRQGGLPVFRLGGDFRVWRTDLVEWIAQQYVTVAESKLPRKGRPKRKS